MEVDKIPILSVSEAVNKINYQVSSLSPDRKIPTARQAYVISKGDIWLYLIKADL